MSDGSAVTGTAHSPPDGGVNNEVMVLVVVVRSETVEAGESCSRTRPITMMITVIA